MSKRHKTPRIPAAPAATLANPVLGYAQSGFDGANYSTRRGYVYFPTLETRREIDSYSRLELIRRARWLKRNVGFARRCINGTANMVGSLMPRPLTTDREWNLAAEKLWRQRAGSAETFDLSGRFNVNSYQPLLTRSRLTDGDILTVFTEAQRGAAVMTYEGHQINNGMRSAGEDGWRDGVKTDTFTKPVAYSVIDNFFEGTAVEVPASACVLSADYDSFGWHRAPSALHHAINHFLDTTEIVSDLKLGIKSSSRIGYYEYAPAGTVANVPGIGDAVRKNLHKETAPKGGNVLVEDTFRGGKIPILDAGREIRQLLDERPHPNSMAFLEHLNRDIAAGLGISSDVLWNIAKLGGASVRYVLADAQTFIQTQQQLLVDQFLTKFWIYFVSKEMQAGRLAKCKDPAFYIVGWLPPAQLTVDIARDGKLAIDLHRAGMLTMKRWYGMQGLDDEEEDRQHVEEYARRIVLCQQIEERYKQAGAVVKLDPAIIFPVSIPGAAPVIPYHSEPSDPEARFSAPEAFARVESSLAELTARFGAAA